MRIRWHGMAGTQHSWTGVTHHYARAMKEIGGHEIFIKSTNGLEHFPNDIRHMLLPGYHGYLSQGPADFVREDGEQIKVMPDKPIAEIADKHRPYDLELAYTIPFQGPRRFFPETRCRAIIWNFESSILPAGWQRYMDSIDYLLPSSQYSYDIFANNGFPKDKMVIVPHGVDTKVFNPNIPPFPLKTEKRVKFLHCARPHDRKLHRRVIRGYLDAFTGDDDVCLVLKTSFITPDPNKIFEVDVRKILEEEYSGRDNPPEIEVVDKYVEHIGSLYTACDAAISMSSCEGFYLPGLEGMACGCLVIAPRHGGQLEYMNDNNALLVDTGEMKAPTTQQYWTAHPDAIVGDPDIEHYKELLRQVYENPKEERDRVKAAVKQTVEKFNWKDMTQIILDLPIPEKSARLRNKKRTLFVVPYNFVGGGEVWVLEAVKQLDKSKFEPEVAFVSSIPADFRKKFDDLGVKTWDVLDETGPWKNQSNGRAATLKVILESRGYELIHFYNSFSIYNVIKEAFKQGLRSRVVETVHSKLKWPDSMSKVAAREPWVTAIAAVTNELGQHLVKMKNKNVVVLPQQVDWPRFLEIERNKSVLDKFGVPTDRPMVGFVGRLSPEKNIPTLLKCSQILKDYSFVLVGDGPQGEQLRNLSSKLENVYFVGKQSNVEEFYASFDVLVLTSVMEGLPLVLLEAMACGTPVVSSDVGGVKEIITDGLNGSVVWNSTDPRLFASSIKQIVENKEQWNLYSKNSIETAKAIQQKGNSLNINTLYNSILYPPKR